MDEMSIQEGIDYIRGKFKGLEAMLAITISTFDHVGLQPGAASRRA